MSFLSRIHLSDQNISMINIDDLGGSHDLTARSSLTYKRFYGVNGVAQSQDCLTPMLARVLAQAVETLGDAKQRPGHLIYCKTQTHNTLPDRHWLRTLADQNGLAAWEVMSLTMTSCASALVQMHFASLTESDEPIIVLTGEKAFHPWVSRLPVGLLGEIPVAAVFNVGPGTWRITGSQVRHLAQFHQNPNAMAPDDRRALQNVYTDELIRFIENALEAYGGKLREDMVFVPHNLNQPVTDAVIRHFGWQDRTFLGDLAHLGHAYCSDPFVNLRALEAAKPDTRQALLLAAGTGVTFAACLLDQISDPQS